MTEVKSFKTEFFQSCVKHSPSEQVNENSTDEISERFINQLEEQILFLREQLRSKYKIINSLINQLWKNIEIIQTPVINPQNKKKMTEENATPAKQKLSHNTETTNRTDLNASVIKTPNVDFTVEKSNKIEKRSIKEYWQKKFKIGKQTSNQKKQRHQNRKVGHNFWR